MAELSATTTWQNVTLSKDEVWRTNGPVFLGTGSEPATTADAWPLDTGDSIGPFATGLTVYYRSTSDNGATIVRMGVSA